MKFLVDRMLGKLAKGLRMLGYDAIYYKGDDAYQLYSLARHDGRVILTRNTKLVQKRPEDHIIAIAEDYPFLQLKEVIQKGHLSLNEENLFSRCLICNAIIDPIPHEEAQGKVPDFIYFQKKDFSQCPQCRRIYWEGSHQENMVKKVEELLRIAQ